MKRFDSQTIKKLMNYVYLLSDPRDGKVFYVGKGKGNRIFNHLDDYSSNPKSSMIKSIRNSGFEPKMEILVHGCDELTVKKVEASVIDLIGKDNLTNAVRGYESTEFGRMDINQINGKYSKKKVLIKENAMLINLAQSFRYNMDPMDLYDYTRGIWRISEGRRNSTTHVFTVYDEIIQETYKVESWFKGGTTYSNRIDISEWKTTNRWEFVGNICKESRNKYLHKSVSEYFATKSQNPIRFTF